MELSKYTPKYLDAFVWEFVVDHYTRTWVNAATVPPISVLAHQNSVALSLIMVFPERRVVFQETP